MKGLLFFIGCALSAIAMGMPEGLPTHSGGMKSRLPCFFYWIYRNGPALFQQMA